MRERMAPCAKKLRMFRPTRAIKEAMPLMPNSPCDAEGATAEDGDEMPGMGALWSPGKILVEAHRDGLAKSAHGRSLS